MTIRLLVITFLAIIVSLIPAVGPAADVEIVDTHAHLTLLSGCAPDEAVDAALGAMDGAGVRVSLVMPPPDPTGRTCEAADLATAVAGSGQRFAVMGGGAALMARLAEALGSGGVTAEDFEATALEILSAGAIGFGEIGVEHFSRHGDDQPYFSAPPDHPLLLRLADVAARHDVPIDLHMEAVAADIDDPASLGYDFPEGVTPPPPLSPAGHRRGAAHDGADPRGPRTRRARGHPGTVPLRPPGARP